MQLLFLFLALCFVAAANRVILNDGAYTQVCEGMYSKKDWGGSLTPHISINLDHFNVPLDFQGKDPARVNYVIFAIKDLEHLGKSYGGNSRKYVCDEMAIDQGMCSSQDLGTFLVDGDYSNTTIHMGQLTAAGKTNMTYRVLETGYYCVSTVDIYRQIQYDGYVSFQNAFGYMSASEIPKLPGYGILTLCYAVALALYGFQFFKKKDKNQILPLQKYLMAMLSFLTFDTLVIWSFYDLVNRSSRTSWFVKVYGVFLSILSSAKTTFSFFLLLLIALGYGVVVLKLPKKVMTRCKIFAGAHFASCMLYLIGSYNFNIANSVTTNTDKAYEGSVWAILPLIPVTITLAGYYLAILCAIRLTTTKLHKQRQVIKLQLYENLARIISGSVLLTVVGLVFSSVIVLSLSRNDAINSNWKIAYFFVEFWPSFIFFAIFLGVAWLWRPTETSYMLAVSQQLSTGEGEGDEGGNLPHGHEFELDDVSLMSHSDDEARTRDSFELGQLDQPPKYESADVEHVPTTSNASNTLFELGDEDDEDPKNPPKTRTD